MQRNRRWKWGVEKQGGNAGSRPPASPTRFVRGPRKVLLEPDQHHHRHRRAEQPEDDEDPVGRHIEPAEAKKQDASDRPEDETQPVGGAEHPPSAIVGRKRLQHGLEGNDVEAGEEAGNQQQHDRHGEIGRRNADRKSVV